MKIARMYTSTKLQDNRSTPVYREALYAANSPTGNFHDSKGFKSLKSFAYDMQRTVSKSADIKKNR